MTWTAASWSGRSVAARTRRPRILCTIASSWGRRCPWAANSTSWRTRTRSCGCCAWIRPTGGWRPSRSAWPTPARRFRWTTRRRFHAAHLAYGEGILVCPTNTGGLLGVDLLTNSLVWAYGYREKGFAATSASQSDPRFGPPPPGMIYLPNGTLVKAPLLSSGLKTTPPVITRGKVVFTAPDASSIHCINLRDGSRLWKHPRQEGDVYLAGVFAGKVVLVGKSYARGLSLVDGSEVWRVETGMPSGIGIASKDVYYLPLAAAVKTHGPRFASSTSRKAVFWPTRARARRKCPATCSSSRATCCRRV